MVELYEKIAKDHNKQLRSLAKKARQRKYFIEKKTIWCPVSISDDGIRKNPKKKTGFLDFIADIYFRSTRNAFSNQFINHYALWIINNEKNRWVEDHFENIMKMKYEQGFKKNKIQLNPDERAFFLEYEKGSIKTSDDLLQCLIIADSYTFDPAHFDYYMYVPVPITGDSKPGGPVTKGKASGSGNLINTKRNRAHCLYVDVGAWSSPQKVGGSGHAPFAIITPDEVVIWDMLATKGCLNKGKGLAEGGMVKAFWDQFKSVMPGKIIFYTHNRLHKGLSTYEGNRRHTLSFKPYIPAPFTNNQFYVVIPDLHLHMFPHSAADNFLEPWKGGGSLAYLLLTLFGYLSDFNAKHDVELFQVGDCYELWESALMLLFARHNRSKDYFGPVWHVLGRFGLPRKLVEKYRDSIRADISKRGLDKVFTGSDLDALEKQPWNSGGLKPVWKKIEKEIQKAHSYPTYDGIHRKIGKRGIFKSDGTINAPGLDWTYVGGNHDSFVSKTKPIDVGMNKAIFMEHGHLRDPFNNPAAMKKGIFLTGINLVGELKKIGDQIKGLESSRRYNTFEPNAGIMNKNRLLNKGSGPEQYSLIVTGHTHRAYVSFLEANKDPQKSYKKIATLYDQGWSSSIGPENIKAILKLLDNVLPSILVTYSLVAPGFLPTPFPLNLVLGLVTSLLLWVVKSGFEDEVKRKLDPYKQK